MNTFSAQLDELVPDGCEAVIVSANTTDAPLLSVKPPEVRRPPAPQLIDPVPDMLLGTVTGFVGYVARSTPVEPHSANVCMLTGVERQLERY